MITRSIRQIETTGEIRYGVARFLSAFRKQTAGVDEVKKKIAISAIATFLVGFLLGPPDYAAQILLGLMASLPCAASLLILARCRFVKESSEGRQTLICVCVTLVWSLSVVCYVWWRSAHGIQGKRTAASQRDADASQQSVSAMMEAEDEMRALVPKLWLRKERFAQDAQMLLGVAVMAEQFSPRPNYRENNADLYRRVLRIEPDNRAAMAALARHSVTRFRRRLQRPLMTLEMMRQYGKRNDLGEVMLPSYSDLFEWFGEEGKAFVMISDFDEARARIIRERSRELPVVRAILAEGRRIDPDNALYDYLDAQLDFKVGRDAEGLVKAREGAEKAELRNYADELAAARRRVLEGAEVPQEKIEIVDWSKSPGYPHVNTGTLFRMADERAKDGDPEAAADIYRLLIRITDQIAEDCRRTNLAGRGTWEATSRHLRRMAEEGLLNVEKSG